MLNNSPEICDPVPIPVIAILILAGLALAYAMNSATFFAGTDGLTTIVRGAHVAFAERRVRRHGAFTKESSLATSVAQDSARPREPPLHGLFLSFQYKVPPSNPLFTGRMENIHLQRMDKASTK